MKYRLIANGNVKFRNSRYVKICGTSAPMLKPAKHIYAMPPDAIAKNAVISEKQIRKRRAQF